MRFLLLPRAIRDFRKNYDEKQATSPPCCLPRKHQTAQRFNRKFNQSAGNPAKFCIFLALNCGPENVFVLCPLFNAFYVHFMMYLGSIFKGISQVGISGIMLD
uniref:(northern house mosquito) hypothetical protein n=1 Tax=Culex pipiens TaxID=7175 RepID=A0A8D8FVH7_CULPI